MQSSQMHFLSTKHSLTLTVAWTKPDQRSSAFSPHAQKVCSPMTPAAAACDWSEGRAVLGVGLFSVGLNVVSVPVVKEC